MSDQHPTAEPADLAAEETEQVEATPAEPAPVETAPADAAPVEATPVEPAEAAPAEAAAEPADVASVNAEPAESADEAPAEQAVSADAAPVESADSAEEPTAEPPTDTADAAAASPTDEPAADEPAAEDAAAPDPAAATESAPGDTAEATPEATTATAEASGAAPTAAAAPDGAIATSAIATDAAPDGATGATGAGPTPDGPTPDGAASDTESALDSVPVDADEGLEDGLPPLSDADLETALEALLLVVDVPAEEEALATALNTTPVRVAEHLRLLSDKYTDQDRGIDLRRAGGGWRFYTRDRYAPYVEKLLLDGQRAKLTRAALETLAVIAYRQPVTRARVAAVRGVNCDGVIRTLLARGLVEETGTDVETGGFLYRTTELFLERLGLSSLDDLPPIAPLLPEVDSIDEL